MFSDRSVNSTTKIIHFIFIAAQESITKELDELLTDLLGKKKTTEEVCASGVLDAIKEHARNKATMLAESSRTAALWIQYMNMIDILRSFIRAERTSNWELHLRTLTEMLPYLAAAGHNLYVKCARLYLQEMASLPNDHPDVHEKFMSGYHSVRRSDRFWGGLSTDLIIEQVLMRSVKTSGGLTRGKGINEHQRLVWLLSMPICAETNRVMQSLSGVDFNSGEQNKDICKARMQRDLKDTVTVLTSLAERSTFAEDPSLRNIMTGVNADSNVNVDAAAEVGTKVLESMTGKSVCSYSFSCCAQAITMASKSSLTIGNESVQVDPQLLFQRLILACNSAEELTSVFQYELASYPTALFESPLMMNPAQKPGLADAIWSTLSPGAKTGPTTQVHYVLDDSSTQDEILLAGENSLVCLYGGRPGQKLDILRYQKYCEKVASRSTRIQPQSLPPTSCAAGFHSLRVQLQVQQWKEHDAGMALGDWGWNVDDQQVTPVMTSKPPAPVALLQIVRCNCQTDCSSRRCTCRRHGLECSPACGQCKGTGCTNSGTLSEEDADDAIE